MVTSEGVCSGCLSRKLEPGWDIGEYLFRQYTDDQISTTNSIFAMFWNHSGLAITIVLLLLKLTFLLIVAEAATWLILAN